MAGGPFANKGYMGLGGYGPDGYTEGGEGGVPQAPSQMPSWMGAQGPPALRPAANPQATRLAAMQKQQAAARAAPAPGARAPGMGMAQPAKPYGGATQLASMQARAKAAMAGRPPATSPLQGKMDALRAGTSGTAPMSGTFAQKNIKPVMP